MTMNVPFRKMKGKVSVVAKWRFLKKGSAPRCLFMCNSYGHVKLKADQRFESLLRIRLLSCMALLACVASVL
jgi:hypothetical protein